MKIGIVLDRFAKGGVAKLCVMEVEELIRQGHDAQLLLLWNAPGDRTYEDIRNRVPTRVISEEAPLPLRWNFPMPLFSFFCFAHLTSFITLPWVIRSGEYDVLIPHGTYTCFSTMGTRLFRGIPYVAYIHDSIYFIIQKAYLTGARGVRKAFYTAVKWLGFWVDRLIFRAALGVAKQTGFEIDYIRRQGARRVLAVPPATAFRAAAPKAEPGSYFLVFSKWDFSKNLPFVLDLIEHLPDVATRFIIAGQWHPPEYEAEIRRLAELKGIGSRIDIIGPVLERDIPDLLRGAIALVHPLFESWGSTLYEAACNGTTFIAVEQTCIADYLQDGVDAFFLRQDDLATFCEKVRLLNGDRGLALAMGRNAWEHVERIDIAHHVRLLVSLCAP